uniref:Uncharacterized protein n=1 Tax=Rhizophora mucronata TaxID=61149 RepID=A0A2P2Q952_RHIMU
MPSLLYHMPSSFPCTCVSNPLQSLILGAMPLNYLTVEIA